MCNFLEEVHHQMQTAFAIFLIRCISLSMVGFIPLVWFVSPCDAFPLPKPMGCIAGVFIELRRASYACIPTKNRLFLSAGDCHNKVLLYKHGNECMILTLRIATF